MVKDDKVTTRIYADVDPETKRRLKAYCALEGVTMNDYVSKIVVKEMNKVKL